MQRTDRFLIAIVVGAVVIVGIAIAVVVFKPEATYVADDTPEGVAHNYLLALQQEDYSMAYGYLSSRLDGYPTTVAQFTDDVKDRSWQFRTGDDVTLKVESSDISASTATVYVLETRFYGGDLFSTGQSIDTFEMEVFREPGGWKITDSDDYFANCWRRERGCNLR